MVSTLTAAIVLLGFQDVEVLIRQLGDNDVGVRERAVAGLREAGPKALPSLRKAAGSSHPEIRAQARQLVRLIEEDERLKRLGKDEWTRWVNPPTKPIAGNVAGESGEPLSGVRVSASSPDGGTTWDVVFTNEKGA